MFGKRKIFEGGEDLTIRRDKHGVAHISAVELEDLYYGLGYCHAFDRGLQMILSRIAGQGRVSEILESGDESLALDLYFRRLNLSNALLVEVGKLSPRVRDLMDFYCDGVNARFEKRVPWELRRLGYTHEPWTAADCILLSRLMGYVNLAQSQTEIEHLFVQLVQAGLSREMLHELFPGILDDYDEDLIRKVQLENPILPDTALLKRIVPSGAGSNNWVVSAARSASGHPLLANDPHLEINRLPNVWYEVSVQAEGRMAVGATMPGIPALLIGRTRDVAWGATYAFADAIDSWIEHCRDGQYLLNDMWIPFKERREVILRKNKPPHEVTFFENDHGVLEGDPNVEGFYLATTWSGADGGATSYNQFMKLWDVPNAERAMEYLGLVETAWNWVIADRDGNTAYQMSGVLPKRREGVSGFAPLPGWEHENDWQGYLQRWELPNVYNPDDGIFVTANQDLNAWGKGRPITMPMGDYRARRIEALLSAKEKLSVKDLKRIQHDVYSLQAEAFMEVLRPLLPATAAGKALRKWDCTYGTRSVGATIFEAVYKGLVSELFAKAGLGDEAGATLQNSTGIVTDFYCNFDRILLSGQSAWFGDESREEFFRRVAGAYLPPTARPWGSQNRVMLSHLLFGGRLPRWLGFDRGPIALKGGRATPHQGQIYESAGRKTTFAPSYRFVTDLGEETIESCLAGGPSDRRFSKWYCSDLSRWVRGAYKTLGTG